MIDLHVHLDGSLTSEQVFALGKLQGVELPGEKPEPLEAVDRSGEETA